MAYSGAETARTARENLGKALAALQEDSNIPSDVMAVAQNIAQAVGALFEAERASSELDGKASVKSALGTISQTLALLQDVRGQHRGVQLATETIAAAMSVLFPLTTVPSRLPPPPDATVKDPQPFGSDPNDMTRPIPSGAVAPNFNAPPSSAAPMAHAATAPRASGASAAPVPANYRGGARESVEVNIGATTESNFFVGFSGEISEGGVFYATYNILPKGTAVKALVTLPGGFEKEVFGTVRFVVDPMDMASDSEPGMGVQFESLDPEARELILRFIRKRPPMFYDE